MAENIKLVTTSEIKVRKIQQMGGDHMVVAAARVSTDGEDAEQYRPGAFRLLVEDNDPAGRYVHQQIVDRWNEQRATKQLAPNPTVEMVEEENKGLIRYLMKQRHGTPFEHSEITFFVHAPIFVWREWHRHRVGFSYNEESGRYKQLDPVFYLPPRDRPMVKVDNWKPGRPKFLTLDEFCETIPREKWFHSSVKEMADWLYDNFCERKRYSYELTYKSYVLSLKCPLYDGVFLELDPGLARIDLPVGIYSSCWVTCNPRSLMHFLSLRTHEPEAQKVSYPLYEIEVAARLAEEFLKEGWPLTYQAWVDFGRTAP